MADIENGPWPFAGRQFDAVVVTNYLWRPLMPTLLASLAPGGVLIYETFTQGNETVGKPSRPDFLLRPGELLDTCRSLRIVAFEDGFQEGPQGQAPRFVQRIAAVREAALPAGRGEALPRQCPARLDTPCLELWVECTIGFLDRFSGSLTPAITPAITLQARHETHYWQHCCTGNAFA